MAAAPQPQFAPNPTFAQPLHQGSPQAFQQYGPPQGYQEGYQQGYQQGYQGMPQYASPQYPQYAQGAPQAWGEPSKY